MRRREFVSLLLVAGIAPECALGQQSSYRIGMLWGVPLNEENLDGFSAGLSSLGFHRSRNVEIINEASSYEALSQGAERLISADVNIIVAVGSAISAQVAMSLTQKIPIVFANGSDPVRTGLVKGLNRPGENVTGISFTTSDLGAKRLELLSALIAPATRVGFFVNPKNPITAGDVEEIQIAAKTLGMQIETAYASTEGEIVDGMQQLSEAGVAGIMVDVDAFFTSRSKLFVQQADKYRLPASYNNRRFATDGGLMSYGDSRVDSFKQAGIYAGRILLGARPGDLPVWQPTRLTLVINLRAAKSMRIAIPPRLMAIVDEVIE